MSKTVLVGVLKSKSDLPLLLEEMWYRIPLAHLPKRPFTHIAFYQPEAFGKEGKRIEYYARVAKREVKKRRELLPHENEHVRQAADYLKCSFKKIERLKSPIRNVVPRRISFGFTDLKTLRSARDILELYHVAPTEQIIERELTRLRIPYQAQHRIAVSGKRYRLDLAVFCKSGNLAIECDNRKAHAGKLQREKDAAKDTALRSLRWRIVRLTESDIMERLDSCIAAIHKEVRSLGGPIV